MEFDQLIFQKIFRFYSRNKQQDSALAARTVALEDLKPKLTLLARALTGDSIDIAPAERDGGWQNNIFYLPASFAKMSTAEGNIGYYIYRTCYLYEQRSMGLNWDMKYDGDLKESVQKSKDTANKVLNQLFEEFTSLEPIYNEIRAMLDAEAAANKKRLAPDYSWLYGHWMKNNPDKTPAELQHISELKKKIAEVAITTEIEAKPADDVQTIQVDKKAQEDFMLTHNFEKADTAEEFTGVWRDFDGDFGRDLIREHYQSSGHHH